MTPTCTTAKEAFLNNVTKYNLTTNQRKDVMTDTQIKRPARLAITDMPRDPQRVLGPVRSTLAASFNYCRQYPKKMAVLKVVIKFMYGKIVQWEKAVAAEEEAKEAAERLAAKEAELSARLEAEEAKVAEEAVKLQKPAE